MGKKRTRSTQTVRPVYAPQVEGAAAQQQAAYTQAQPMIGQVSSNLGQVSNDLFSQYRQGDPTIQAAQTYLQNTIEGGDNPYIDDMLDISNDRVRNQMQAQLSRRGATGGSDYTNLITRALAENETGTRFNQFNQSEARRLQAAGMAPGLLQGSYLPLQMGAQLGTQGAMLPLQASLANSAGVAGLLGPYTNTENRTVQSGGLLGSILSAAAQAGMSAAMACDIRLKENIERIGETPAGLPVYRFDYIGSERGMIGPMAHEVAIMQPEALGPVIDGYMTVIPARLQ